MRKACIALMAFVAAAALAAGSSVFAEVEPHAGMLRYPDVSSTQIAFLYANDLWIVPKEGGVAIPLASPPGGELFPRFSPDGKTIAFVGDYDGNFDIYTVPVTGGVPFRVTHHPASEILTDWTSEGRLIFYAYGVLEYPRAQELFWVPSTGGLPEKFPVPYGANGTVSEDGKWLAYTPHSRDFRTWKRYRGGMATDIWLFHLKKHNSRKITDWEGTDTQPMWHGRRLYYLSDAGPEHRLNIWVYDLEKKTNRQVTSYKEHDVKWPAIGPGSDGEGEIVFQLGRDLYLLNLETEEAKRIKVVIPGDKPKIRKKLTPVSDLIYRKNISSTGKRAVVGARGDIWTLPAKKGSPINITRTSGTAEREPAWSPDGKWIAYFSDATGEYELYITRSDGRGETRKLTSHGKGFLYYPAWSPDSKWIAFWDQNGRLFIHSIDSTITRQVDQTVTNGRSRVSWSMDSRWLTYARSEHANTPSTIFLYSVAGGERHKVTSGMFEDSWPVFDRDGKYLYFASSRDFSSPMYEDLGTTWIYAGTELLFAVPLRKDVEPPIPIEVDEEKWEEKKAEEEGGEEKEKKEKKEEEKKEGKEEKVEPVKIDLEGFEKRAVKLPVDRGLFARLSVNDNGKLIYARLPVRGSGGKPSIHLLDLDDEKEKEKTVIEGTGEFYISSDGKKLLVVKNGKMAIVDAKPKQKMEDLISTEDMKIEIDPRKEWKQIFVDAWRIQRDFFYAPNMHGVDWEAVRRNYEEMLEYCASREDVSYVIREMISELNVGHAYYWGGDVEKPPRETVGMLGCDFEIANGAYRVKRIVEGAPWDYDGKGPLSRPDVDVEVGDYVLAVNGIPIDASKDPWAAFQGMAGEVVTLTVNDEPEIDEKARYVNVELLGSERELRYRAWVEKNRSYVEKKSGGRVGYIYVPNTGIQGQNELVRQFFGQLDREALIVDERWNGGGQVPTRFVELLNRPLANYWALRDSKEDYPWPPDAHFGPKCMLINGLAGSGGDYFPYWFRESGLGKLIGTRTWGGLVGISGNPRLIDGGYTSAPTFAFYEKDGTWGIEGHGVDPDIEVVDDPALMVDGSDPQLDRAIEEMLAELKERPAKKPPRPPYPDRSGMGIRPEDH